MPIINRIAEFHPEMTEWRRDIHAHPETAFEENRTSELVATKLKEWGIEVHTGLGKTGVVGVLKAGNSDRTIGLRADMDALHIEEANDLPYASRIEGKMHACGHDGHTTMLLGAARYLAETKNFDGTVYFIFQPAEENEGGGRAMIEDGLFKKFQMEQVYGMHNWPGMPTGVFGVRAGPVMASFDLFEINITGSGCHAAMPQMGIDPIVCASSLISALQTVPARNINALDSAVISVTQIHAGDTWNVIPENVMLGGTTRTFLPEIQDKVEQRMGELVEHVCKAHGCEGHLRYERRYPSTINSEKETEVSAGIAKKVAGEERVILDPEPTMGAEDFAFMLNEKPGCYVFIGNGEDSAPVHNPHYNFNDEVLPHGASYWATLVESQLDKDAA
jgi:hippurate hydrolase